MEIAPLIHPIEDHFVEFKLKMGKSSLHFLRVPQGKVEWLDLSLVLEHPSMPITTSSFCNGY
jgi:hypothetical protein